MRMPDYFQIALQSAQTLASQGKGDQAADAYLRAAALLPDSVEAYVHVSSALQSLGRLDDALRLFFTVIQLHPDRPEGRNVLGMALMQKGRAGEAIAEFRKVTELRPQDPRGFNNLGCMFGLAERTQEAITALRHALVLDPNNPAAYQNLGNALKDFGDVDAAIASYDKALNLNPHSTATASNRLYALHFSSAYDAQAIHREHQRWGKRYSAAREAIIAHDNNPSLNRRLRVGYVSPDFREHVVGWNLRPLLRHHDHQHFEIFCYASVTNPDSLTREVVGLVDHCRNVLGVSDDEVARLVRADHIDILVDLSLHLNNHRLAVFARKPAPVEVTYLGYCGTTGLDAVDYRFSDPEMDPTGAEVNSYCEETVRLPRTCCQPPKNVSGGGQLGGPQALGNLSEHSLGSLRRLIAQFRDRCALPITGPA